MGESSIWMYACMYVGGMFVCLFLSSHTHNQYTHTYTHTVQTSVRGQVEYPSVQEIDPYEPNTFGFIEAGVVLVRACVRALDCVGWVDCVCSICIVVLCMRRVDRYYSAPPPLPTKNGFNNHPPMHNHTKTHNLNNNRAPTAWRGWCGCAPRATWRKKAWACLG